MGTPGHTDDETRLEDLLHGSQLAASQLRRLRRIVDAATQLAEKGGFDGVKLRDVAEVSEVALGTLYKYFRSKEDILLFALAEEVERMEASLGAKPIEGGSPLQRLTAFFQQGTRSLTRKPHFARAVLRSLASGDAETAAKVAEFHGRMSTMIVSVLRGQAVEDARKDGAPAVGTEREREMAGVLQNVWYASLIGWAGGLHTTKAVAEHVITAAALMRIRSKND